MDRISHSSWTHGGRVWVAGLALGVLAGCGGASHAASSASMPPGPTTQASRLDALQPIRDLVDQLDRSDAAFDATYRQTAPDGTTLEYRFARSGSRARFENTALGQHVVVIRDGDHGWRCTGAVGQPATSCAADTTTDFDTRYNPRLSAQMVPKLLGVGGDPVTVTHANDTIAGQPVRCEWFRQPRPGRALEGRLCVTDDGLLAIDDFGHTHVELASLTRDVTDALFAPAGS